MRKSWASLLHCEIETGSPRAVLIPQYFHHPGGLLLSSLKLIPLLPEFFLQKVSVNTCTFIHLFRRYLLNSYYVPRIVTIAGCAEMT